jgi:hypothetical protein
VLSAANELIHPDRALILAVGDASQIHEEVAAAGFGPLEVVQPS